MKRGETQDNEVNKAKEKYEKVFEKGKYDNLLEEAEAFKRKVRVIRDALKDDLNPALPTHVGYDILHRAVQMNDRVASVIYSKDSPTASAIAES